MIAQFCDEINEIVEELKEDLSQKIPYWSQIRTPSELFDFEQELQKTLNTLQANIVRTVLEAIHQDSEFLIDCQKQALHQSGLHSNGWRRVSVRTLSGQKVRIQTLHSRKSKKNFQKQKEKQDVQKKTGIIYPVLRRLGIVRRTTPRMVAECNRQMADGPSGAEAEERLVSREIMCFQVPMWFHLRDFASIALWQRKEAVSKLENVLKIEPAPLAGKRVVVGIDGGRLRIRTSKREDDLSKGKEFTTNKCEPKIFVIYTIDKNGNKERDREVIYDGTIQGAEHLFALLVLRLKQLGIAEAELLVITGDGAHWIWKRSADLPVRLGLEKVQVVEVVDFCHSVSKLTKPAKLGIQGNEGATKWFKEMRKLLKKGQVDTVITALEKLDRKQDTEGEICKAIEYFQTHKTRMQYAQFRAEGIPIGSGVIESAVRRIINLRMNGASIFWLPESAESVLYLRCQSKSGRWVDFVKSVLTQWADDMSLSLQQVQQIRQQIASRFLESHAPVWINSREEIIKWAVNLLEEDDALIVDTETTGLSSQDEIIQLAILDLDGKVLLDTLLKPTMPISSEAYELHGIGSQSLKNAPSILELYDEIANLIRNRYLVAYNAAFDQRLLTQTCNRHGLPKFEVAGWYCAMEKYTYFRGKQDSEKDYKSPSLISACTQQGIIVDRAHEAVQDCLLTLELIKSMANSARRGK